MKMNDKYIFPDPSKHPDWIIPHSPEWYSQLNNSIGEYRYPWKSTFDMPTAETMFADYLSSYITQDSRILDVGCGHGDFTSSWGYKVKEVIEIDNRENFIKRANKNNTNESTKYLVVNADEKLPFPNNYFDIIYTKKGPWLYKEASRILKNNGIIVGLYHGGTDGGFRKLFPGLFSPLPFDPYNFDVVEERHKLNQSVGLSQMGIRVLEEVEFLAAPEDVLIKKCFGQSEKLQDFVWSQCLKGVKEIFYKHATEKGLRVINYHHLITAK
jgi:SAM-dependent methyltransferase